MADVNRAGVAWMNMVQLENVPDLYPIRARSDENWIGASITAIISDVEASDPTHTLTVGNGVVIESATLFWLQIPALHYRDYHFFKICITPLVGETIRIEGKITIHLWQR